MIEHFKEWCKEDKTESFPIGSTDPPDGHCTDAAFIEGIEHSKVGYLKNGKSDYKIDLNDLKVL